MAQSCHVGQKAVLHLVMSAVFVGFKTLLKKSPCCLDMSLPETGVKKITAQGCLSSWNCNKLFQNRKTCQRG